MTMVRMRSIYQFAVAATLACGALLSPLRASAAPIEISASGVWVPSAPKSAWTAPGGTWAFSFVMDDQPALTDAWDTGFNPVFSSFEYRLAGAVVSAPPVIAFNTPGSLVVSFGPVTGFQLFGPILFSGATTAPTIHTGSYVLAAQTNTVEPYFEIDSNIVQFLTGTVLHVDPAPGVPEPAVLLLLAGPGAAGLLLRGRRQGRGQSVRRPAARKARRRFRENVDAAVCDQAR
jgi:hypothetical protein